MIFATLQQSLAGRASDVLHHLAQLKFARIVITRSPFVFNLSDNVRKTVLVTISRREDK